MFFDGAFLLAVLPFSVVLGVSSWFAARHLDRKGISSLGPRDFLLAATVLLVCDLLVCAFLFAVGAGGHGGGYCSDAQFGYSCLLSFIVVVICPLAGLLAYRLREIPGIKIVVPFYVLALASAILLFVFRIGLWPPVMFALRNNYLSLTRLLVERGADVNERDLCGIAPLPYAAKVHDDQVVKLLIEHGADVNAKLREGRVGADYDYRALHWAARRNRLELAKLLLKSGAALDRPPAPDPTPDPLCLVEGSRPMTELFVDRILAETASTDKHAGVLLRAVESGSVDAVNMLLDLGADPNMGVDGSTPFHGACRRAKESLVTLLLERGADVNVRNKHGMTPLIYAAWRGHRDRVRMLLEMGADVNAKDDFGQTAFSVATDKRVRELLLRHGARQE